MTFNARTRHSVIRAGAMLLVAALLALLAAACGGNNQPPEPSSPAAGGVMNTGTAASGKPVELSFWNGFTGPDGELLKQIVDEFNQQNAGKIEVNMDVMMWDLLFQKLPPAIATKTAPQLVAFSNAAGPGYMSNGSLEPLDDYFAATGSDPSDFTDASLELFRYKDGKQYMLPLQTNGIYLFWNKKLFREAGLDPEKPPATLEEMADIAVKLTKPEQNQYGLALPVKSAPTYFVSFMKGNGGEVVDMANLKSALDSPENLATLQWLQDLGQNKKVSPQGATGAALDKLMLGGQLGMYITGPWLTGGLKANNVEFGVAQIPSGSKTRFVELGGIGFAVPAGTTAEQKQAAYAFIKFWNSPDNMKRWSLANGFPPHLKAVIGDPDVKADANVATMADMGDAAQTFLPGLVNAERINRDVLFPMVEAVLSGVDPAGVLKKTSAQLDEILKTEP